MTAARKFSIEILEWIQNIFFEIFWRSHILSIIIWVAYVVSHQFKHYQHRMVRASVTVKSLHILECVLTVSSINCNILIIIFIASISIYHVFIQGSNWPVSSIFFFRICFESRVSRLVRQINIIRQNVEQVIKSVLVPHWYIKILFRERKMSTCRISDHGNSHLVAIFTEFLFKWPEF